MLKNKDFIELGFTNETIVNDKHPLDTVLVYQYIGKGANLIFKKYPNTPKFEIWEGRATVDKHYADVVLGSRQGLESLVNVYIAKSAMLEEKE